MTEVFVGTEALAAGRLTRHELRRWYRPLFRDVLVPKGYEPTLRDRTFGAWLWSRRQAVVTGLAASASHGDRYVDAQVPIELIWHSSRPHPGLLVRAERIAADEIVQIDGMSVASPSRAAFDLGRYQRRPRAVAALDSLARAIAVPTFDLDELVSRYPGSRGVRQLQQVLPLVDAGAQSPKETWLRLLLIDDGLPTPTTQIPVIDDGYVIAYLDLGWKRYMVAVEYDGEQHRTSRRQYVRDIRRSELLEEQGWTVIRVVADDSPVSVLRRVRDALRRRGYSETDDKQRGTRTSAA